jgi:hypothetical protein
VVLEGVSEALRVLKGCGVRLPAPFTAEVIATWVSEFWLGMELVDLLGAPESKLPNRAALDAMQKLLEQLDARAAKQAKAKRRKA